MPSSAHLTRLNEYPKRPLLDEVAGALSFLFKLSVSMDETDEINSATSTPTLGFPENMSLEYALVNLEEVARCRSEGTLCKGLPSAELMLIVRAAFEIAYRELPALQQAYEEESVYRIEWYREQVALWDASQKEA